MYEELINKLRYCGNAVSCIHCPYWEGCAGTKEYLTEAADAIEKLKILADNGEATYEIMVRQTSYIEKLKQKIPHWIPVTERLPEKGVDVLVFAEGKIEGFFGDTVIAISNRYDFKIFTDFEEVEVWRSPWQYFLTDYEITHWMPLPEPPEDGE